jgi:putative glycerol-1-phosphate prenyltransferase
MTLGLRATYVDAGSGANRAVAPEMIRAARAASKGPLFIGGGVRSADGVRAARAAGADFVVVGTRFEQGGARAVRELALAARA